MLLTQSRIILNETESESRWSLIISWMQIRNNLEKILMSTDFLQTNVVSVGSAFRGVRKIKVPSLRERIREYRFR